MKITKRQRKAQRGPNEAVKRSLRDGQNQGAFVGKNPEYVNVNAGQVGLPDHWVKVKAGIPFVRANAMESSDG